MRPLTEALPTPTVCTSRAYLFYTEAWMIGQNAVEGGKPEVDISGHY